MLSYADFLAGSFPSSSSAGLGSPATQGTSVPQPQPASIIEDRLLKEFLVAPRRELLPKLSPNGEPNTSWFRRINSNAICKSILKCFYSLLELPYPTYAHVPLEIQKMWLRSFAARKQYMSNVTEWKKKWRLKKDKPICLNQDVWDGFKAYWQLDATAHIAATNSGNRRSKRGGKGEAVHNGGAKTREEREIEMNVPIKKGRRYGIGRTSKAISTSSSQLSVSSSSIVQYMERMKTELDEERTKRQAIEEELRRRDRFHFQPLPGSSRNSNPADSPTQSPDDRCF
ncbi:hypothetical protein Bca52824_088197 [Brassica carinata]|uniref:Uncharacterized protein n=1 Tax=Brassica carinata TaxID=52824 RepID=A0A8X7P9M7_BRACI|nr:hypothetical protein Bca52824_088197 [Brassica carinata]